MAEMFLKNFRSAELGTRELLLPAYRKTKRNRFSHHIVKPENTWTLYKTQNPTSLARFPNLATLESVNLSVGFTINTKVWTIGIR